MNGLVTRVSADVTTDQRTGANLLHDPRLVAAGRGRPPRRGQDHLGHAGRAFVQTGDRTMFSYLMKPFSDQFMRSFREK